MKQSAVKILGVAALGAAFAATAAGSASAAPADAGAALDTVGAVGQTVPVDEVTGQLPTPLAEGAAAAGSAVDTIKFTTPFALDAVKASNPIERLLGGVPVNGLTNGGLPINGIPLGG